MEICHKYLKIGSFINFFEAVIFYLIGSSYFYIFLFIIGIIAYLLSLKDDYYLLKRRTLIAFLGFFTIMLTPISSILFILTWDKLSHYKNNVNAPPRIKEEISPEVKKIDILLKLGVGMVIISGILFATTSWNFISDIIKVIALLIFGIIFLGLSLFSEKKLKIKKTTYIYWILGISFLLFVIVGLLYFGTFNPALTYNGVGKDLAYSITYFVLGGLLLATYLKFPKDYLLYGTYISIVLFLYTLLNFFKLDSILIIIIFQTLVTIINIFINKNTKLFNFSKILSYLLFVMTFDLILSDANKYLLTILGIINIINFKYLENNSSSNEEKILNFIIPYIILLFIIKLPLVSNIVNLLLIMIILSIYQLLIKFNIPRKKDEYLKNISFISYSLSSIIIYLQLTESPKFLLLVSLIYLIVTLISSYKLLNSEEIKISNYTKQIAIFILVISTVNLNIIQVDYKVLLILVITTLIYTLCHIFIKDTKSKFNYSLGIVIGSLSTIILNIGYKELYPNIILLVPCLYLFIINHKDNTDHLIYTYILLLFNIYTFIFNINILDINIYLQSFIFLWLLVIILIVSKNELVKKITYFAITIPIYQVVSNLDFNDNYKSIIVSILILYITFLIIKYFSKENSNVVALIGLIFSIINVIFIKDIVVGLYVGIIALITIMIGYNKKEYNILFKAGIIITIINILYQLKDFWELVPFWLYLLVGGLSIIGFVTYKELNKKN